MKKLILSILLCSFMLSACGGMGGLSKDEVFKEFKTVDLSGNEVSEAIFSEKEITMVNFWGSTCGPCLDELDELQEIHQKLPENVGLVGILVDVPAGYEKGVERANEALLRAGAEYQNILPDDALLEYTNGLSLTPYTIFVDKDRNIVGKRIKGADPTAFVEELESLVPGLKWKVE